MGQEVGYVYVIRLSIANYLKSLPNPVIMENKLDGGNQSPLNPTLQEDPAVPHIMGIPEGDSNIIKRLWSWPWGPAHSHLSNGRDT